MSRNLLSRAWFATFIAAEGCSLLAGGTTIVTSDLVCPPVRTVGGIVETQSVRELRLELRGVGIHASERFAGQVVLPTSASGDAGTGATVQQAVFVLDPLDALGRASGDQSFNPVIVMPGLVPPGSRFDVNFFADRRHDGDLVPSFEAPNDNPDHRYIRALCPNGSVVFEHSANFQNFAAVETPNGRLVARTRGMGERDLITMRLQAATAGQAPRTLAFLRLRRRTVDGGLTGLESLPLVLDDQFTYTLVANVDREPNGVVDGDDAECTLGALTVSGASPTLNLMVSVSAAGCTIARDP